MKCQKCGGDMEEGLIADYGYGGAGKSYWTTKVKGIGVFTKLDNKKELITYRCTKCGLTESYAK